MEEEEISEPQPTRQVVQQVQLPPIDYDADDGLIDVSNLAQLNAIRWDLNGDGKLDQEEFANSYNQAFPGTIANMGIPATPKPKATNSLLISTSTLIFWN